MIKAFQKLEKKRKADERKRVYSAARAKHAEAVKQARTKAKRKKKIIERTALAATIIFTGAIATIVWYAKPKLFEGQQLKGWLAPPSGKSSGLLTDIDCKDKKNRNKSVCQRKKIRAQNEKNWDGITLNARGKETPFQLYKKKNKKGMRE